MRRSMLSARSRPGAPARMLSTSSTLRPLLSWITRLAPSSPAEPVIEGQLRALLAVVVDVGEAEHVPGHFAGRIVAAVLARQVHAGDAPAARTLARVGGLQAARQVQELAVEVAG